MGWIGLAAMWMGCASAAEPPAGVAPSPATAPFEIRVTLDAAAVAELTARKEAITVDFMVCDSGADDAATCHAHHAQLGAAGGVAAIPAVSLAPGARGEAVTHASVNVFTARRSSERNLLDCAPWLDEVSRLPPQVAIPCKLL